MNQETKETLEKLSQKLEKDRCEVEKEASQSGGKKKWLLEGRGIGISWAITEIDALFFEDDEKGEP